MGYILIKFNHNRKSQFLENLNLECWFYDSYSHTRSYKEIMKYGKTNMFKQNLIKISPHILVLERYTDDRHSLF